MIYQVNVTQRIFFLEEKDVEEAIVAYLASKGISPIEGETGSITAGKVSACTYTFQTKKEVK